MSGIKQPNLLGKMVLNSFYIFEHVKKKVM